MPLRVGTIELRSRGMKIVFLDIDGVLNSQAYDRVRGLYDGVIDESRLPLLKRILQQSDAKVVLTSSWRRHFDPEGIETDYGYHVMFFSGAAWESGIRDTLAGEANDAYLKDIQSGVSMTINAKYYDRITG